VKMSVIALQRHVTGRMAVHTAGTLQHGSDRLEGRDRFPGGRSRAGRRG